MARQDVDGLPTEDQEMASDDEHDWMVIAMMPVMVRETSPGEYVSDADGETLLIQSQIGCDACGMSLREGWGTPCKAN